MSRLDRVLRPRHIAVLGAAWAVNVIEQCQKMGFAGEIWPVHPRKDQIAGVKAYASLADLPEAPDAVFIGVNRHATIDLVRELSQMGAGGAICFAAGWGEAGAADLQAELVQAAGDMPILGPNCYGVINYLDGALLWPDQHGGVRVEKGVALLSQSSNVIVNLGMQQRGLPVGYIACLGNAAVVGLAELAEALLEDPRITALGIYAEGMEDAPAFARLAHRAAEWGKGIAVIKSGKTALSQAAAASHTASLAGGGAASSAFLRALGVAEVNSPAELLEVLKIYHCHGRIGTRLCSLSCSGGEAGLAADLGAPFGLDFPPVPVATAQALSEVLGPIVGIANPLDYNTFIWGDLEKTTQVFAAMLQAYDAGLYIIDMPREDRCDASSYFPALEAIKAAQAQTGKPAFPIASLSENFGEARVRDLLAEGICPLLGFETGLAAIAAAQRPAGRKGWEPLAARPARDGAALLDEASAKHWLKAQGIAVPKGVSAAKLQALPALAKDLARPLVLKGLGFAHKTEAGAVRLGLHDLEAEAEMPGASGYLVEEMVKDAVAEVLLGLQRDPVYGITLTLGMGGVTAEVLADTVTLIWPATLEDIRLSLRDLKLYPLLDGYRGRPKADLSALAQVAYDLASAMARDDSIEEIEINPLMLRQKGAVAVDALIRKD